MDNKTALFRWVSVKELPKKQRSHVKIFRWKDTGTIFQKTFDSMKDGNGNVGLQDRLENLEVYSVLTKSGWDERITTYDKYGRALNGTAFTPESPWKHFYNKNAREEYVLMNRPCLSLNDIEYLLKDGSSVFEKLKNLVKTKL